MQVLCCLCFNCKSQTQLRATQPKKTRAARYRFEWTDTEKSKAAENDEQSDGNAWHCRVAWFCKYHSPAPNLKRLKQEKINISASITGDGNLATFLHCLCFLCEAYVPSSSLRTLSSHRIRQRVQRSRIVLQGLGYGRQRTSDRLQDTQIRCRSRHRASRFRGKTAL